MQITRASPSTSAFGFGGIHHKRAGIAGSLEFPVYTEAHVVVAVQHHDIHAASPAVGDDGEIRAPVFEVSVGAQNDVGTPPAVFGGGT